MRALCYGSNCLTIYLQTSVTAQHVLFINSLHNSCLLENVGHCRGEPEQAENKFGIGRTSRYLCIRDS